MAQFREATHRDLVLFINHIRPSTPEAISTYSKRYDKKISILILVDNKKKKLLAAANQLAKNKKINVISCDLNSPIKIKKELAPYIDRLLAVSCQYENSIPHLSKILPHVPYLNGPTQESLEWATDKIKMRRMLKAHNPKITPLFTVIKDGSIESIEKIEKNVGYPVIVKPAGLAASLLVSVCYHREELERTLKLTYRKINKLYKDKLGRGSVQILVEQLMEGSMYSIDSYVNDRGNIYHAPPVHVKTGRAIGFDDFFGYQRLTPTKLNNYKIEGANQVTAEAIKALGLRSTTCHTELMRTAKGWKIIELAPRMGGFRHTMYDLSFGINHILNDILIRIPQKPQILKKRKGYTAVFNIYANLEGRLQAVKGVKKLKSLESFVHIDNNKKKGDTLLFARNGGDAVLVVVLFNKVRSDLLADIRRMEKSIDIVVTPKNKKS